MCPNRRSPRRRRYLKDEPRQLLPLLYPESTLPWYLRLSVEPKMDRLRRPLRHVRNHCQKRMTMARQKVLRLCLAPQTQPPQVFLRLDSSARPSTPCQFQCCCAYCCETLSVAAAGGDAKARSLMMNRRCSRTVQSRTTRHQTHLSAHDAAYAQRAVLAVPSGRVEPVLV